MRSTSLPSEAATCKSTISGQGGRLGGILSCSFHYQNSAASRLREVRIFQVGWPEFFFFFFWKPGVWLWICRARFRLSLEISWAAVPFAATLFLIVWLIWTCTSTKKNLSTNRPNGSSKQTTQNFTNDEPHHVLSSAHDQWTVEDLSKLEFTVFSLIICLTECVCVCFRLSTFCRMMTVVTGRAGDHAAGLREQLAAAAVGREAARSQISRRPRGKSTSCGPRAAPAPRPGPSRPRSACTPWWSEMISVSPVPSPLTPPSNEQDLQTEVFRSQKTNPAVTENGMLGVSNLSASSIWAVEHLWHLTWFSLQKWISEPSSRELIWWSQHNVVWGLPSRRIMNCLDLNPRSYSLHATANKQHSGNTKSSQGSTRVSLCLDFASLIFGQSWQLLWTFSQKKKPSSLTKKRKKTFSEWRENSVKVQCNLTRCKIGRVSCEL